MIDTITAIHSLVLNAEFTTTNGEIDTWHSTDITQPTDAEIQAEVTRLQTEYDSLAYARSRKEEYDKLPSSRCNSMTNEMALQLGQIQSTRLNLNSLKENN